MHHMELWHSPQRYRLCHEVSQNKTVPKAAPAEGLLGFEGQYATGPWGCSITSKSALRTTQDHWANGTHWPKLWETHSPWILYWDIPGWGTTLQHNTKTKEKSWQQNHIRPFNFRIWHAIASIEMTFSIEYPFATYCLIFDNNNN